MNIRNYQFGWITTEFDGINSKFGWIINEFGGIIAELDVIIPKLDGNKLIGTL